MRSIRTKIILLTISAILVSILAIGWISIYFSRMEEDRASAETLRLICDDRKKTLDAYLEGIEHSIHVASRLATEDLDSVALVEAGVIGADGTGTWTGGQDRTPEQLALADEYLSGHTEALLAAFRNLANNTPGVVTFYYYINPELCTDYHGFLYSRIGKAGFEEAEANDVTDFDKDDFGHVGWYYIPLEHGRPIWIAPYDNENFGVRIVSYAAPIYKAGTFIGIMGMDIGYDTLVSQIDDIHLYESGYACLLDEAGNIVYHPNFDPGTSIFEIFDGIDVDYEMFTRPDSGERPISYNLDGEERELAFTTLKSGLRLAVIAPKHEINANWMRMVTLILLAGLIILVVFVLFTTWMMKRITDPLKKLTDASQLLAGGNYEVKLDYTGSDEVGILTRAFQQMLDHLKVYISNLNSQAYTDALTGVKNKAAFDITMTRLNYAIKFAEIGQSTDFSIAMFDCNNLKEINDVYGHDKGDIYLRNACRLICKHFAHSPVFRIGGDEFTVILQKYDWKNREELKKQFDEEAEQINAGAKEPWERIDIARGVAMFHVGRDRDAESVLRRADAKMYIDKKRLKALRHAQSLREEKKDTT